MARPGGAWQGEAWRGEYYGNRKLEGAPVLVRNDSAVDFDWGSGSPDPAVPADKFSVRWTRTIELDPGTYRFFTSSDDGVRIYVDGKRIVDEFVPVAGGDPHAREHLLANEGQVVRTVLEFGDNLRTQLDDILRLVHLHDSRVALPQPLGEPCLGTTDDGRDIPQGIVEIHCYRAYTVHVLPASSRWTTIVVRFDKSPQPG
jgi:hypothetical protein